MGTKRAAPEPTEHITGLVTPDQKKRIAAAAGLTGRSTAVLIRDVVSAEAERILRTQGVRA